MVVTRAEVAAASFPPLIADNARRTRLISAIGAPLRSKAAVIACLSASDSPATGIGSSADPPPETNASR